MTPDLVLRDARIDDAGATRATDIGIRDGCIVALAPRIDAAAEVFDCGGRFVSPGLVDTHVHLDKSCIMDRVRIEQGTLAEAIEQTSKAKAGFTEADVHARARRTLERAILQGTMHMRTHVEVDPGIGLKGLVPVLALAREYAWAIDLEVCVFPQEGLTNLPGTEELMVAALERGARVVGACPYTDTDPQAQIHRVFALARRFDADIDMHLDFSLDPSQSHVDAVCRATERNGYAGRVAIGHVSTLSALEPDAFARAAAQLAGAGVAVTVLPSTDLFLMGRGATHNVPRGTAPVHRLVDAGVNCSLATNNVMNPFTPFGDCSLNRMANLYANIAQIGTPAGFAECHRLVTDRPARLMRLAGYGIAIGNAADLVVFDAPDRVTAVCELAPPLAGFKRGRRTFTRVPAMLHRPG